MPTFTDGQVLAIFISMAIAATGGYEVAIVLSLASFTRSVTVDEVQALGRIALSFHLLSTFWRIFLIEGGD